MGVATGSLGLICDALHLSCTVLALATALVSFVLSKRSPSFSFPAGFSRAPHTIGFTNAVLLIFAAVFAYFIVLEQPQCFSKDGKAYGVQYSNTEDVTIEFYWLSLAGLSLLLLQAIVYYI